MRLLKTCRTCLITGVKMRKIETYGLENAYKMLIGCQVFDLPLYLCFECAALLKKCSVFREKALRAKTLLRNLAYAYSEVTQSHVEAINRQKEGMLSPFAINTISNIIDHHYNDNLMKVESGVNNEEFQDKVVSDFQHDSVKVEVEDMEPKPMDTQNFDISDDGDNASFDESSSNECVEEPIENIVHNKPRTVGVKQPIRKKYERKRKRIYKKKTDRSRYTCALKSSEFTTVINLTPEQQREELMKRKETVNYKDSQFKCDLCYRGFCEEKPFKNHMLKHDPVSGPVECEVCKIRFPNRHQMWKHVGGLHRTKFVCKRCPHVCPSQWQAKAHEKWHSGVTYPCKKCHQEFSKRSTLLTHTRLKHPSEFVCDLCGNKYLSERGVSAHKKLVHRLDQVNEESKKSFYCEECDVKFATEQAWKLHFIASVKHNPDSMVIGCDVCGEKFDSSEDLRAHHRIHPKRPMRKVSTYNATFNQNCWPVKCEQCEQIMNSSREYKNHFSSAHPGQNRTVYPERRTPCMCETCGQVFAVPSLLKFHQRKHTEDTPFKCDVCNKIFTYAFFLKEHKLTHTGEKPYPCKTCGKRFNARSNRDRHQKLHTGVKPHKCETCGKSFLQPSSLKAHMDYSHNNKPWPKRDRSGKRKRKLASASSEN